MTFNQMKRLTAAGMLLLAVTFMMPACTGDGNGGVHNSQRSTDPSGNSSSSTGLSDSTSTGTNGMGNSGSPTDTSTLRNNTMKKDSVRR